jgi:hypothetical protein
VLFELISERYERKSLAITANTPFSQWGEVFVEPAMTLRSVVFSRRLAVFVLNLDHIVCFMGRRAQGCMQDVSAKPGAEQQSYMEPRWRKK